jgi:hypothetical protein
MEEMLCVCMPCFDAGDSVESFSDVVLFAAAYGVPYNRAPLQKRQDVRYEGWVVDYAFRGGQSFGHERDFTEAAWDIS